VQALCADFFVSMACDSEEEVVGYEYADAEIRVMGSVVGGDVVILGSG
jgi:hypothetical protein